MLPERGEWTGIRMPGCFVLRGLGVHGDKLSWLREAALTKRGWGLQWPGLGKVAMSPALASFRDKVKPCGPSLGQAGHKWQ